MIAIVVATERKRIPELYEFLDAHGPDWRFYNVYDNEAAEADKNQRIRAMNLAFVEQSREVETDGYTSETTVVVSPQCGMAVRLCWNVITLIDLRKLESSGDGLI